MTPADRPHQLVRLKDDNDNAEPSGNSVALSNLIRLSNLTGRGDLRSMAEKTLKLFSGRLTQTPFALPQMVAAYRHWIQIPLQVVIAGNPAAKETQALLRVVNSKFIPFKTLIVIDEKTRPALLALQPALDALVSAHEKPIAYVCENFACKLPTTDPAGLGKLLQSP